MSLIRGRVPGDPPGGPPGDPPKMAFLGVPRGTPRGPLRGPPQIGPFGDPPGPPIRDPQKWPFWGSPGPIDLVVIPDPQICQNRYAMRKPTRHHLLIMAKRIRPPRLPQGRESFLSTYLVIIKVCYHSDVGVCSYLEFGDPAHKN